MVRSRLRLAGVAAAALLAAAGPVMAAPYSAEVVFGDSLSDNGAGAAAPAPGPGGAAGAAGQRIPVPKWGR